MIPKHVIDVIDLVCRLIERVGPCEMLELLGLNEDSEEHGQWAPAVIVDVPDGLQFMMFGSRCHFGERPQVFRNTRHETARILSAAHFGEPPQHAEFGFALIDSDTARLLGIISTPTPTPQDPLWR